MSTKFITALIYHGHKLLSLIDADFPLRFVAEMVRWKVSEDFHFQSSSLKSIQFPLSRVSLAPNKLSS
jgi:hypothetical protein